MIFFNLVKHVNTMKKQLIILLLALIMIVIHLYEIITNDIQKIYNWFVLVLAFLILIHTIQKVRNYKRDNLLNKWVFTTEL